MRHIKAWLADIVEFLWSVLNSWAGYTTGGIIVALVWLWTTISEIPLSRRVGIGLALLFLFMAFFNAWRKQYRRRLVLEREKQSQDNRTGSVLIISKCVSDGQYLLHVNPHEDATDDQIKEWRFKVQNWTEQTSGYLWAVANTKFNDFLDSDAPDFYGAHTSIWADLGILRTRLRNLKEIMEKPDIYLAGIG